MVGGCASTPKVVPNSPEAKAAIEAKIRSQFNREPTKADLKEVTHLYLNGKKLTSVKGLEKLTKLKMLRLEKNPDLTKAQIDELKKALPKCKIVSNPKK